MGIAKAGSKQTELELNDSEAQIGMAETNKHDHCVLNELAKIGGYSYISLMFGVGIIPCLGRVKFLKVTQMHIKDIQDLSTFDSMGGGGANYGL